jgi:hypothetical protein
MADLEAPSGERLEKELASSKEHLGTTVALLHDRAATLSLG